MMRRWQHVCSCCGGRSRQRCWSCGIGDAAALGDGAAVAAVGMEGGGCWRYGRHAAALGVVAAAAVVEVEGGGW